MKKFISLLLAGVFMIQFNISSFASFDAPKLSESEWNELYSSLRNSNTLPTLNVGADETQASLCWHADKATAKAEVKLSKKCRYERCKAFQRNNHPCRNRFTGYLQSLCYGT